MFQADGKTACADCVSDQDADQAEAPDAVERWNAGGRGQNEMSPGG